MNHISAQPYPGPALDAENVIRLLELQAGQTGDPITVRLLACSFATMSYEAVSYAWGDTNQETEIHVLADSDDEPYASIFVTTNCHNALIALRQCHRPRVLWIDAICINQHSMPERNHQVSLMAQIYQGARRVVVYLGQSADGSDEAIHSIREIDQPSNYGASRQHVERQCLSNIKSICALFKRPWFHASPRYGERQRLSKRESICALFKRPWFHRVWVLQEIAFAKDAIFVCGQHEVGWDSIRAFCHWNRNHHWVGEGLPYPIEYTVERSRDKTDFIHYNHRLYKLLKNTKDCQATDSRDKVYAVLPLLNWEHANMIRELDANQNQSANKSVGELDANRLRQASLIQPDYEKSVQQVYTMLTSILLEHFGLQALQFGLALRHVEKLPTWVIDWEAITKLPYHFQQPLGSLRPQDASPVESSSIYSISHFFTMDKEPKGQLRVMALEIGTITSIGDTCDIRRNIFPLKQWGGLGSDPRWWHQRPTRPPDLNELEQSSWRQHCDLSPFAETLAAGYVVYANVIRIAVEAMTSLDEGDNITEMKESYTRFEDYPKGLPASYARQSRKILNACDGRRFFITDTGYIGLAPEAATPGDLTFKVNGCDVPFVMRQWADADTESPAIVSRQAEGSVLVPRSMTMVGECWIHGITSSLDLSKESLGMSKPESCKSYPEQLVIY